MATDIFTGFASMFGNMLRPGTASGGAQQSVSQSVSQAQANYQTVNIGSTTGTPTNMDAMIPSALGSLFGTTPSATISTGAGFNYWWLILGAGAIVTVAYLSKKKSSQPARYSREITV